MTPREAKYLFVVAMLVSCANRLTRAPEPAEAVAADKHEAFLVWVLSEDGQRETTHELVVDGVSVEVPRILPGIHVWVEDRQVILKRQTNRFGKCLCDHENPAEAICSPDDFGTVDSLQLESGGEMKTLIDPINDDEMQPNDSFDANNTIEVIATLGPYAAVRHEYYVIYPCEPHGLWWTKFLWFDLRDGTIIDILSELSLPEAIRAEATDSLCTEFANDVVDATAEYSDDLAKCEAQITGVKPVLNGSIFQAAYIAEIDVPYCLSRGNNAYGRSGFFGAVALGKRFESYDTVPVPIIDYVKSLPNTILGGFSSRTNQKGPEGVNP